MTSNGKDGKSQVESQPYKEYDHTNYWCEVNDVWLETKSQFQNSSLPVKKDIPLNHQCCY